MTIALNDEQGRLLAEVVEAGTARSPEDAVDQAVRALLHRLQGRGRFTSRWTTWPTCLRNLRSAASIWILSDMDFERDKDTGRNIAL